MQAGCGGGNANIAGFYFDFATQEEQSLSSILGSMLKQIVGGLNEVPQKLVEAFRDKWRGHWRSEASARENCRVLIGDLLITTYIYMH